MAAKKKATKKATTISRDEIDANHDIVRHDPADGNAVVIPHDDALTETRYKALCLIGEAWIDARTLRERFASSGLPMGKVAFYTLIGKVHQSGLVDADDRPEGNTTRRFYCRNRRGTAACIRHFRHAEELIRLVLPLPRTGHRPTPARKVLAMT